MKISLKWNLIHHFKVLSFVENCGYAGMHIFLLESKLVVTLETILKQLK